WYFYAGQTNRDANWADLLVGITSPLGAKTDLRYVPSTTFEFVALGMIYPVVAETRLTGPALDESKKCFWYAGAKVGASWDDAARIEYLGFEETWAHDVTTGIAEHTRWTPRTHLQAAHCSS